MNSITTSLLIVLAISFEVCSACTCAPPSFNRRLSYCKADFTIKGKVVEYMGLETPLSSQKQHKKYKVHPSTFYRNPTIEMRTIYIYTPYGSSLCEKNLLVNKTYIFNGKFLHDQYIINRCEWNQRWTFVPNWVKLMLNFFYNFC